MLHKVNPECGTVNQRHTLTLTHFATSATEPNAARDRDKGRRGAALSRARGPKGATVS